MANFYSLDPVHASFRWWDDPFAQQKWREKYRDREEETIFDTHKRIAHSIMRGDGSEYVSRATEAMGKGLWIPAGRIHAGAGTEKKVTLINCFVNQTVGDSMKEILQAHEVTMLTLQQGGGMGTNFSTLRPSGARLGRLGDGAVASGPLPFMHMWDAGSHAIRTVGGRNGAMMGTLSINHPDLLKFVHAKQKKGALQQFNVSVLVTDAFMQAVEDDEDWYLHFPIEPTFRDPKLVSLDFEDDGVTQYVYSVHKARDLWAEITKNTYEWSEPGVIFVDKINEWNNNQYFEDIQCTNPCGEQPLPPNDACDLGHLNLARMVRDPFTPRARFDFDLLEQIAALGQRFLDNVVDVTDYPVEAQRQTHYASRRTGLGFTGLASALAQLGLRYGSAQAVRMTERITQGLCLAAYSTSTDLAIEKGPFELFPVYEPDLYLQGFAGRMLPDDLKDKIRKSGIRNSVLLTVAPVGTTSVVYGDVESGCEPMFALSYKRKSLAADGHTWEEFDRKAYTWRFYEHAVGEEVTKEQLPDYFVTAQDLTVSDHIGIQAAAQKWIDASVSKTINLPEDISYDDFVQVYTQAYHSGCKGCTTYRPSEVRGSILSIEGAGKGGDIAKHAIPRARLDVLTGYTYKLKWPSWKSALYLTINHQPDGRPTEIFFSSLDARYLDWTMPLTRMISALLRQPDLDPLFIAEELQQIVSTHDTGFIKMPDGTGRTFHSLAAYIGYTLEQHFNKTQAIKEAPQVSKPPKHDKCPQCSQMTLIKESGCEKCNNCGYSKC